MTNLITFYDKMTCLTEEGTAVDIVFLDFSKAFNTFSHKVLLERLLNCGPESTMRWHC